MAKPPTLTELSDAQRERAAERYAILRPFREAGVPLPTLTQTDEPSLRTLRPGVAHYRQRGLAGLARQPRADREAPQRVTPDLAKLMKLRGAFAESERALIRERQREGLAPAQQRGVYRGGEVARSTVRRAELRQLLAAVAREFGISRETLYQYLQTAR